MLPLRDNIPSETTPFVNYLMIGICTVVFLFQLVDQRDKKAEMVEKYGMIPQRVRHPGQRIEMKEAVLVRTRSGDIQKRVEVREAAAPPFAPWLTLLTCTFLHGGWMHFLGNMWFLYIFGDNVEDRFGHIGYLIMYLAWGIAASFTHLITNADSTIPTIGASGAIAGVMGAYMWLHPHGRVVTLVPLGILSRVMELPAVLFLGIWFVIQLFSGTMSMGGVEASGVAWWAHIGGFAVGFLSAVIIGFLRGNSPGRQPPSDPPSDRVYYQPPSQTY